MQSWRKALFYLSQIGTAELRRYNINTRGLPYKGKMYFYIIVLWADPLMEGFVLWVGSDTQSPAAKWACYWGQGAQPAFGSSNGYGVWGWGWVEWQKLRLGSWKEPSFCWTKGTCECFLLKTVLERSRSRKHAVKAVVSFPGRLSAASTSTSLDLDFNFNILIIW